MEVFITVITGTLVYVLSQLLSKFIIDPIQKFKEVIGNIASAISYYGREYTSLGAMPKEKINEAHETFRSLSGELQTRVLLIPYYNFWAKLHFVPKVDIVAAATKSLIFLSNVVQMKPDQAPDLEKILTNETAIKALYLKQK